MQFVAKFILSFRKMHFLKDVKKSQAERSYIYNEKKIKKNIFFTFFFTFLMLNQQKYS